MDSRMKGWCMAEGRYMKPALDKFRECNSLEMNKAEAACNMLASYSYFLQEVCSSKVLNKQEECNK